MKLLYRWCWQINYEFANTCKNVLCKRTSFINITIIFYAGVPAIHNIDSSVSEIYQLSLPTLIPVLTHWGRVTHTCDSKLTMIGPDNDLSPGRCQAIIRTKAGILIIWTLITNFNEILNEIYTFSFTKRIWKCRLWNGGDLF